MTLVIADLADEIKTEIENEFGSAEDQTQLEDYSTAIATALINYLKANGVVTTVIGGGSSAGSYTGAIT